ncbi:hypothetical protein OAU50_02815 [Planctomycetota bacterium]|nr:hypothetical protein [Planctomycetota bacterium]
MYKPSRENGVSGSRLKGVTLLFVLHGFWCLAFVLLVFLDSKDGLQGFPDPADVAGVVISFVPIPWVLLVSALFFQFVYGTVAALYYESKNETRTYDGVVEGMCATFFGGWLVLVVAAATITVEQPPMR